MNPLLTQRDSAGIFARNAPILFYLTHQNLSHADRGRHGVGRPLLALRSLRNVGGLLELLNAKHI
jgi:hypothetical protein